MFRDSAGRLCVLDEYCPHRRVSLAFGRNEECGLRCLYHGWKMDVEGNVVEMASAGSIAMATALPDSNVVSVDSDPQIFANGFRQIPVELTQGTSIASNDEKIDKTKELLDNWKPEITDAKNTGHTDNEFDLSITLNNPNTFKDYVSEMARITKSGGYVIAIDHEVFKDKDDPSFYETGKFNAPSYKPYGKLDEETANKLGLETVPVPESIREYENAVTWTSESQEYSSGFAVQIYRKK